MKYVLIHAKARAISTQDFDDIQTAQRACGLTPGEVDHGMLGRKIGYCVYQFGLFVPPAEQSYFGIAGTLIAGNALLYGVTPRGESCDLYKSMIPDVTFYLGRNDIEAAIERREIGRPYMAFNDEMLWQWPQPRKTPQTKKENLT